MVDQYGYPTKGDLKRIKHFEGTPEQFVEYVGSIWANGAGWEVREETDRWGTTEKVITFVTGGWSGCEETISVVGKTMFSFAFHSMWRRGGLFEYRVTEKMWAAEGFYGWFTNIPKPEAA